MDNELTDGTAALRSALGGSRRLWVLLAGIIAAFLTTPIVIVFLTAFTRSAIVQLPFGTGGSIKWFVAVLTDPGWTGPLMLSVRIAGGAAVLATVCGTLAALGIRRVSRGAGVMRAFLIGPLVLPHIVYALGLFNFGFVLNLGYGATWPIVVGQATLAIPLAFITVSAGLAGVDPVTVRAAASLGARWPTTVLRIELPAIWRQIGVGAVFSFVFTFDEIMVALFLADPGSETLPVTIFNSAEESVNSAISAASSIVMAVAICILALVSLANGKSRSDKPMPGSRTALSGNEDT